MDSKKDINSLCRIKVNKMLSSLNSNKNIFIPKYTLINRTEEKYSYLNKSKGNSIRANINKIHKNQNPKNYMIKNNNIPTTEENYINQPIDFIINHGVLVYQRNFKGEEVINLGINNEYLRKNNFNMIKNDNSIYQTESNLKPSNNNTIYNNRSKQSWSIQKNLKIASSKKTLGAMTDIPITQKQNSSSRQKKMLISHLNTTQNSISSINSFSVKTFLASTKNKKENNIKNNFNINIKNNENNNSDNNTLNERNSKKIINYLRKKEEYNINKDKLRIFRKKKNYSTLVGNMGNFGISKLNNKNKISNLKENQDIPNIIDQKYKIKHITNNNSIIETKNLNNNNNSEMNSKLKKFIMNINSIINYYLKNIFHILKENSSINNNKSQFEDNISIKKMIFPKKNKNKIEVNGVALDKFKQNKHFKNSFYNPEHKKSNSIIVNKISSTKTASEKNLQKNNSNNCLTLLINKNFHFFSKDKDNNNKRERDKSELYRDSKSLQKKYEQICRRKKKNFTNTFSDKFKDAGSTIENNCLSEFNKTNSFSNFNDNISVNSLQLKNNKRFNQIIFKDNSINSNEFNFDKNDNDTDNKKDKNIYKIKLLKSNFNNKKGIGNYRTAKNISNIPNNNFKNFIEIKDNKQNYKTESNAPQQFCFSPYDDKKRDNLGKINKISKPMFILKRKNYLFDEKNIFKLKELCLKNQEDKSHKNNIRKKNVKNIITKDKRISIYITYISYDPKIFILKNYDMSLLKVQNIINYNYINSAKKNKNIIKRKNIVDKKLTLIKEEDEKSKCLNSTKSSRVIDDEFNSNKKINKNIKISKDLNNCNINKVKIGFLLEKYFCNHFFIDKREFFLNLKIISLVSHVENVLYKKLKDNNIIKYLKKKIKTKNTIVYGSKIKKNKIKRNNNQIKDKIFFNNIIINENILSSQSFDFSNKIKNIEMPKLNNKIKNKKNKKKNNLSDFLCKSENNRYNNKYE